MKIKTKKIVEFEEVEFVKIYIGDDRYLIEEREGRLNIIKYSDGDNYHIQAHPIAKNEIQLS